MADSGDLNRPPSNVQVGSGDFQPNPIYGDNPVASTYDDNRGQDQYENQQPESYDYPENGVEDEDANNPFADDASAQAGGVPDEVNGNRGAPPPYSEDPPSPPVAYQQQPVYGNGTNEPEDVVAQMNAQHPQAQYSNDDPDYGITQPKISGDGLDIPEDENEGEGMFGNFTLRAVYMASSLLFCSMLSFSLWFSDLDPICGLIEDCNSFKTAYGLSGFGAFMIFLGSIGALVFMLMKKFGRPIPAEKITMFAIIGFYVTGAVFYLIGACATAAAWNKRSSSYIAGIFFAEQFFVGFHAAAAAMDLWRQDILNRKKWRTLIYSGAFVFLGVVDFFAWAVTSTTFDGDGIDNAGPALLALFYFLILIPLIIYLVIFLIPKLQERLGRPIVLVVLSGVFALCCLMLLIGYFVVTGNFGSGVKGRGYFVGIGFFVLLNGVVIAMDMFLERFIPGFKDGGVNEQAPAAGIEQTDSY